MLKYIQNLINKFKSRKSGMQNNAALWQNQPVTTTQIDGYIQQLEDVDTEIEKIKDELEQKQKQARQLEEQLKIKLGQIDNLAIGLHANTPDKLNEYDIKLRKPKEEKPVPGKAVIESIIDDVDGEGFILNIKKLETADFYEIEKGVSPSPTDRVLAPPYPLLKATKKTTVLDDYVEKGKRYFYRVRGVNPTGAGEWSEPVSRVQ